MWFYVFASFFLYGFAHFYRKTALEGIDPLVAGFVETISQFLVAWLAVFAFSQLTLQGFSIESVAAGFAVFAASACVFLALRSGYVSSVSTVINLNALVSVPLAIAFLGEFLSLRAAAGVALAILVVPLFRSARPASSGNWLKYSLLAMFFFGVMNHFNAFVTRSIGAFLAYAFLMTSAAAFFSVLVFSRKTRELHALRFASLEKLFFSGLVFATATLCMLKAFSLGPASIVVPAVNLNFLVTALLGVVFYKEALGSRGLLAVALAVVSVWLLAG
ncbi:hypothetical protein AUJ15_00230 [Candidatus Micrarchaeota archaeon CG1_02_55_41]|nr:MAG: hypothetical protein AUJ15_00230 [Candidatus Micrarchaeota archaeon CG1_02_55_41]